MATEDVGFAGEVTRLDTRKANRGLNRAFSYFRFENAILLVPICSFAIFDSAYSSFSSVLNLVALQFPDAPQVLVQSMLTLPSLVAVPTMLLSGILATVVDKRAVGLFAMAILLAGAMLPVFIRVPNIFVLLTSSMVIGIAQGLMHPLASAVVCENWKEGERKKILGFKQAANYLGAAVFALVVGHIAMTGWQNAYLVYLVVVPAFVVSYFRMPKGKLDKKIVSVGQRASGLREIFTPKTVYLFALVALAAVFQFSFHSNIAMSMAERGLGSSAEVSFITSSNYVVSFALGLGFGHISGFLKDKTLVFGFMCMAVGLTMAALGGSFPVVFIGGMLFGFGAGIQEISTVYYLSRETSDHITMVISLGLAFINIGVAVSPLVITGIKTVLLGTVSASTGMLVGAMGFVCLAIVELVYRIKVVDESMQGVPSTLNNH